jgi:hypothetical protein
MECANMILICSLIGILIGFCVFISQKCNFSMWLHIAAMCIIAATSNMLTRTFARLYFMNTRAMKCAKGMVETSGCAGTNEEKMALAQVDNRTASMMNGAEPQMTAIEMNKISEQNGSNEALLPAQTTTSVQPAVNLTEASPVKADPTPSMA